MEKFNLNSNNKNEKKPKRLRTRIGAFGAAAIAGFSSAGATASPKVQDNLEPKNKYEKPAVEGEFYTAVDSSGKEFPENNVNEPRNLAQETGINQQEEEKLKLKLAIEGNSPNRFYDFEKYEKYSKEAKDFASWVCSLYNTMDSEEGDNLAPREIFTDEYYMAVALTESGGSVDAESGSGAIGAMQLKPIAVIDLPRLAAVFKRRGLNIENYNEGEYLDVALAKEVLEMSKHDYPLNISMGKSFLKGVYVTYPDFQEDLDLITTSYNFGASRVKKVVNGELEYNEEAKGYAPKVNLYLENINIVKSKYPDLNNSKVRDIVRDFGHHRGQITTDFITAQVGPGDQVATR